MFHALNAKLVEIRNRILDAAANDERGQTTTEYVAVTAIGVAIAASVLFVALDTALDGAVAEIATELTSFIS